MGYICIESITQKINNAYIVFAVDICLQLIDALLIGFLLFFQVFELFPVLVLIVCIIHVNFLVQTHQRSQQKILVVLPRLSNSKECRQDN